MTELARTKRPPLRWPFFCSVALPLDRSLPHIARMPAPSFPNLTVLDHPLIQHKLSILRDKRTSTRDFKQLVGEIATLMAYEVTKDLPTEEVEVETPLETMTGRQVAGKKLTLVPILRAGLGMVDGIAQLIPSARVGHIGLYRDHDTLRARGLLLQDPGLRGRARFLHSRSDARNRWLRRRGGRARSAGAGARRIRFLCLVAAPEGVRRMLEAHPDIPIYTASLDRELNASGYILPGLGDAGDRLFGTRTL